MFVVLTLLSLIFLMPYGVSATRTCEPNTQFQVNDYSCDCNSVGRWSEADCKITEPTNCQPGKIVLQDCNRCICQENGQLQCTIKTCDNAVNINKNFDLENSWCMPFVSYYINCSLCVCPASGKMDEASCAKDVACPYEETTDFLKTVKKNICIPYVMYLFPCLQCYCPSEGLFNINKCIETCPMSHVSDTIRRCIPKTFYRKDCNICWCPENSIADDKVCTKSLCHEEELNSLANLKNTTWSCQRNHFTHPKCFFCECHSNGTVNKDACLQTECLNIDYYKYGFVQDRCSPGEMVTVCTQCLCLWNGLTDPKYCTNACSHTQKLNILKIAANEMPNSKIIDTHVLKNADPYDVCDPNSIYLDSGKYCLCPDIGSTKHQLCILITERTNSKIQMDKSNVGRSSIAIDFNAACEPSSFVNFDCNTCYCLKTGKLDPNWCTYDDCEAKKIIKSDRKIPDFGTLNGECTPGALSKEECNFCICPESGKLKDKACTKNKCTGFENSLAEKNFTCEPQQYYDVDCNICHCPKNGIKNVALCTKNICDKRFLRTDYYACIPGDLFSENCSVCVCPLNGDKIDSVCTNNTCSDTSTPWTNTFKVSESLDSHEEDMTRILDLCFPGEEFVMGCKVCICPDMGLKVYATCTYSLCDDGNLDVKEDFTGKLVAMLSDATSSSSSSRRSQSDSKSCITSTTFDCERKECTPGSLYIIRCRQCICPYMGSIHHFCRPLPKNFYCEQAFPGYNYLPMGRRIEKGNTTDASVAHLNETVHTHACDQPGRVIDECFICECEGNAIIEEHCFRSSAKGCVNKTPTFFSRK